MVNKTLKIPQTHDDICILFIYVLSVAYIMSVSHITWRDALRVVRVGRKIANPNTGFQLQLQDFEQNKADEERRRMKERYPSVASEF